MTLLYFLGILLLYVNIVILLLSILLLLLYANIVIMVFAFGKQRLMAQPTALSTHAYNALV